MSPRTCAKGTCDRIIAWDRMWCAEHSHGQQIVCDQCGGEGLIDRNTACGACRGTGKCKPEPETFTSAEPNASPPEHARFRRDGGATQRAAGESLRGGDLTNLQRLVLAAVLDLHAKGCAGANASEVQVHLEPTRFVETNSIDSRFNELRQKGYLRQSGDRPGLSGKSQQVHYPTDKGREWMADRSAA